jgi:hypothetical protein
MAGYPGEEIHRDLEEARAKHQAERRKLGHSPYNDRRWRRRAKDFLVLHPCCAGCGEPAQICDHITPLSWRDDDPLLSSVQSLCKRCAGVKWKLEQKFKRGEVTEDDLVMSSKAAQKLRHEKLGADIDGMPLSPEHPWRQTINDRKGLK